jgi:diguanylate cyclase (GGDEF)-like protein
MKANRVPTIRSRLVLLVIACVVPASFMAALLIRQGYQRERERLERDSIATARAMVQAVDGELTGVRIAAEVLSFSPDLARGSLIAFYKEAQALLGRQIGHNVVLSDASGQQLVNTLRPFGEPLPHHGNLAQLRKVFDTERPVVSDVYIGGLLRQPVLSVDVPVFRDGAAIYDLSIGVLPDRFTHVLRDQRLPPDWIAVVFDASGTIVARTHETERFVGMKGAHALVKRMTELDEDSIETLTVEGIDVVSFFSRSPASRWSVAIGIPTADLTADLRRSAAWGVAGLAALLASTLWAAWSISDRISRSVRGLSAPALALGAGEAVVVPSLHLREADEVAQAMTKVSEMLRDARHHANHDSLTGLANRAMLGEIIDSQIAICDRGHSALAVLFIDLDRFKVVNDRYGHATGDAVLCEVAERLKRRIRSSDVAARLGGDEFAVVMVNTNIEAATVLAEELKASLCAPYPVGPVVLDIRASIGIACYPSSGLERDAILQRADAAMYLAKLAGGGRVLLAQTPTQPPDSA